MLGGLPRTRPHRRSDKRAATVETREATAESTAAPAAKPKRAGKPRKTEPKPAAGAKAASARKTAAGPRASTSRTRAKPKAKTAAGPTDIAAAGPLDIAAAGPTDVSAAESADVTAAKPPKVTAAKRRTGTMRQPAQPRGAPTTSRPIKRPTAATDRPARPASTGGREIVGTAVQAAAELAEIGLSVGARAIRTAVSRLPRP